jgi:hypothetical protein
MAIGVSDCDQPSRDRNLVALLVDCLRSNGEVKEVSWTVLAGYFVKSTLVFENSMRRTLKTLSPAFERNFFIHFQRVGTS